jgi:error-prone DNA polymerase
MFDYAPVVGFSNPDVPWSTLEGALSGRELPDGGDGPAFSRKRDPYVPAEHVDPVGRGPVGERVPYAELHCHSNFSFLDGASHPEELVEQAARLGLDAIALTDHDGMYGVVRFAEAARELGVATVFGSELSLGLTAPQNGVADPEGSHLLLLARDPDGYRALCHTISTAQLRGREKGRPIYDLDEVVADTAGHVVALTGCRKGAVQQALRRGGPGAGEAALRELVARFGPGNVAVELDPSRAADRYRAQRRPGPARRPGRGAHDREYRRALRHPRPVPPGLGDGGGARAAQPRRYRRLAPRRRRRLPARRRRDGRPVRARYPGAVARAAQLGRECAFALDPGRAAPAAVPGARWAQ